MWRYNVWLTYNQGIVEMNAELKQNIILQSCVCVCVFADSEAFYPDKVKAMCCNVQTCSFYLYFILPVVLLSQSNMYRYLCKAILCASLWP